MEPFEYQLLFAAVILGLAISELALSVHRLVSASDRVHWDWLAPLAAVLVFLKIITQWWSWYAAQALHGGLRFEMFIAVMGGGVLLFLLAAMVLPDVKHGDSVNLAHYYERVRRRFWVLLTLHWLVATAVSVWAQVAVGGARFSFASPVYLIVLLTLGLAFIRARWVHGLALLALCGLYLAQFFGQQLAPI